MTARSATDVFRNTTLKRWRRDPIAFVREALRDPETGKPFVLYAEDRGLMPKGDVYQKHYAVSGLFNRLREDQARYPDTMDARYGAWAQLLALFRLIHDGGGHGDLHFPARHGRLFDPDAYPFLEGRPLGSHRSMGELVDPPRVSDGVVFRVLQNLLAEYRAA